MDTSINYYFADLIECNHKLDLSEVTWKEWQVVFKRLLHQLPFEKTGTKKLLELVKTEFEKRHGQSRGRFKCEFQEGVGVNTQAYLTSHQGTVVSDEKVEYVLAETDAGKKVWHRPRWQLDKSIVVYAEGTFVKVTFVELRHEVNDLGKIVVKSLRQYSLPEDETWKLVGEESSALFLLSLSIYFEEWQLDLGRRHQSVLGAYKKLKGMTERVMNQ